MLLSIILTLLLAILTLFVYCTFIPSLRTYILVNKLPGPKGLPLIGSALTINGLKTYELLGYFKSLIDEFHRLVLIWLLGVPMVIVHEAEDLAEVLGSVVNLKKGVEYKPLIPWLNEGLLLSVGEKWHSRRKLLTPTFHFKILEENLLSMQNHAKHLVDKLLQQTGQILNIEEIIPLYTLDVICETAMGIQLGALDNPTMEYVNCIKSVGLLTIHRVQNLYLHREWIFGLTPKGKEFEKNLTKLHEFTIKMIRERKAKYIEDKAKNNDDDDETMSKKRKAFLDLLLELDTDNKLSEKDIREEVDTFLFEGHDTTASAIMYSIFVLGIHQDIQAKVVEELESVLDGNDGPLTKQHLNDLRYMEKVIKEVLRIYPSVPYISRQLDHDIKLKGDVILPAGTNIIISPFVVHRNAKQFPEPEKFDPERFSTENINARHSFAYIPFSAGPKNCIGQKFAMMEIKVALANILRSLHIETVTKLEDLKCSPLLILRPDVPMNVKLTSRKSKH